MPSRSSAPNCPRNCSRKRGSRLRQGYGAASNTQHSDVRITTSVQHPVLAIDHGEARIGLAATDDLGIAVHPVETITREQVDAVERISEVCRERGIKQLVLGLPLRTDGSEGASAEKVRAFGEALAQALPRLPLTYCDERFTTMSAGSKLREAGKSARAQKELIDQGAAMEILNDWLGW